MINRRLRDLALASFSSLLVLFGSIPEAACASPKTEWLELGEFELASGQARVSDPCYKKTEKASSIAGVLPARKGKWLAAIRISDEKDLGKQVSELLVIHESQPQKLQWKEAGFLVGVDSGTAGVFDDAHYRDDSVLPDKAGKGNTPKQPAVPAKEVPEPGESWYERYVIDMEGEAQVIPFGVVSRSGFGDGGYRCMVARNAEGKVEAIRLIFIGEGKVGDEWRAVVRKVLRRSP